MKKKLILLGLAVVLAGAATVGGTLAGFNTEADRKGVAQITTKSLSIEIQEERQEVRLEEKARPGDTLTFSRNIVNSEEEGYDLYTRVTIYKRWDRDGLEADKIHLYLGEKELISENDEAIREAGWILWYQDGEQVVLYHRMPLAPGEATGEVLSALTIDADVDNAYAGAEVILEFDVDAVQKIAAQDAIVAEWGVYPEFDENGYLVSISE